MTAGHEPHLEAARLLATSWQRGQHIGELPAHCRPRTREEGFAVQGLWESLTGLSVGGWKIAATSEAGQRHIAVDGPLAGPVFASHVHGGGATVSLAANRMRVAECEVVFRMGRTLAPRDGGYGRDEVLAAVATIQPGIEVPDSRFERFELAGAAQLIADCACSNEMIIGAAVAPDERVATLPDLVVRAQVSDGRQPTGSGRNVLGDPVTALCWLVAELGRAGRTLQAGQFVTTGACVPPIPVLPGQRVEADFGWIGRIEATFA
jgi:2-keto-4-pentenoate hydratase